jgi:hypothetical protein
LILLWLPDNKPNIQENTKKRVRKGRGRGRGRKQKAQKVLPTSMKRSSCFLTLPSFARVWEGMRDHKRSDCTHHPHIGITTTKKTLKLHQ